MISLRHLFLIINSFIIIHRGSFSYSEPSPGTTLNKKKCDTVTDDSSDFQTILFFAPLNSDQVKEQIVIYYYHYELKPNYTVAIYETDPETGDPDLIYSFDPPTKNGIRHTGIIPNKLTYKVKSNYKKHCLGYSGAWLENGEVLKMTCLSTRPDWMSERKQILQNRTLKDLFIPGTHDSGSYSENPVQTIIEKFTVTQDRDVLEQLISGVRYLDIRPAFYGEYWVNHGSFKMNPMKDIIDDVKEFLNNTEEIVILSFREFPKGFESQTDHLDFIKYLQTEFAGYFLRTSNQYQWNTTLGKIWETGKRLILSYDHKIQDIKNAVWSPIEQYWGDVRNLTELKTFIKYAEVAGSNPKAVMAQFTFDTWGIVKNTGAHFVGMDTKSILKYGAEVGPHVTQWYNELFYVDANIVAVDFVDATGIVEVAIWWNDQKYSPCSPYYSFFLSK